MIAKKIVGVVSQKNNWFCSLKKLPRYMFFQLLSSVLFASALYAQSCEKIPREKLAQLSNKTLIALETLEKGLLTKNALGLTNLFHPKLEISVDDITKIFSNQFDVLGEFTEVATSLWLATLPDSKSFEVDCDTVKFFSHYGYEKQVLVKLDLRGGKNEEGVVYTTMVERPDGEWVLGSFHWQAVTFRKKNAGVWTETANSFQELGKCLMEGVSEKLQVATKNVVEKDQRNKICQNAALFGKQVVHTEPLLTGDGLVLLVRSQVAQEPTHETVKTECENLKDTLKKEKWFEFFQGVRCSYIFADENPLEEGRIGSVQILL